MKKDKNSYEDLVLRCECFAHHYFIFTVWHNTTKQKGKEVSLIIENLFEPTTFFQRLKNAFYYVFKNEKILMDDVMLYRKKIEKLYNFLGKILKKNKKREREKK